MAILLKFRGFSARIFFFVVVVTSLQSGKRDQVDNTRTYRTKGNGPGVFHETSSSRRRRLSLSLSLSLPLSLSLSLFALPTRDATKTPAINASSPFVLFLASDARRDPKTRSLGVRGRDLAGRMTETNCKKKGRLSRPSSEISWGGGREKKKDQEARALLLFFCVHVLKFLMMVVHPRYLSRLRPLLARSARSRSSFSSFLPPPLSLSLSLFLSLSLSFFVFFSTFVLSLFIAAPGSRSVSPFVARSAPLFLHSPPPPRFWAYRQAAATSKPSSPIVNARKNG